MKQQTDKIQFLTTAARRISNFFLEIFFPERCVACGKYGLLLCGNCAALIEQIITSTCPSCGKIIKGGQYCDRCKRREKLTLSAVLVTAHYHKGPMQQLIYGLKYEGMTDLSEILGEIMHARIAREKLPNDLVLVPVPLHSSKLKKRGFNQSLLIGEYLAKKSSIPAVNALKRTKNTKSQTGLSRQGRLLNVAGAFDCVDGDFVMGKNVLLVDDVFTTGATLNQCALALKEAGAKKIIAVVAARNI